jgi:transmembrane sensor
MTEKHQPARVVVSARVRAEAAAWIARLHGPDRIAADDRGFKSWLAASEAHARAFEQMTELWEAGSRLKSNALTEVGRRTRVPLRTGRARAATVAAVLSVLIGFALIFLMKSTAITTGVGEQHVLVLKDGTRITLNTDTRLKVRFDKKQRHIDLEKGEALFEVAKRPEWPFVVSTGEKDVLALGTVFLVRQDVKQIAVTLLEGRVEVISKAASSADEGAVRPPLKKDTQSAAVDRKQYIVLAAGQRVIFEPNGATRLDEPSLDKVTAWKRGLVEFDNTPLADAIAEMNRYSVVPVELKTEDRIDVRVSGVFRAGDSQDFARAVAQAYGLGISEEADSFLLTPRPQN